MQLQLTYQHGHCFNDFFAICIDTMIGIKYNDGKTAEAASDPVLWSC